MTKGPGHLQTIVYMSSFISVPFPFECMWFQWMIISFMYMLKLLVI